MYRIVREPIDPAALEATARTDACGGIVAFFGVVRERSDDGRPVRGLAYEAFEPMAQAEFEAIAAEARERFGEVRFAIAHRVGELAIGEIAVAVVAAAAHRGAAFDACRYAIDEIKRRAPIWKKEAYVDGGGEWRSNTCDE